MDIPFKQGVMRLASAPDEESCLIGSKCNSCGAVAFPKRVVCHKCRGDAVSEVPLSKKGTLASFTVAWAAPEGFSPPLMLGYVDLPEKVRLLTMVTGCEPSPHALDLGQAMEVVFEAIREDEDNNRVIAFKFRPAAKGGTP